MVEAVIEDLDAKVDLLRELGDACPEADLATTTSSLPIAELASRSGHADRIFGFHVFNPVQRMELVELCLPEGVREGVRERARAWAGRSARRRSRFPTSPASSSTACSFPTCSTPCG